MRPPDYPLLRDLAPDIEHPRRHWFAASGLRTLLAEPVVGKGIDAASAGGDRPVVAVKPPARSSLDALCGRPISVGRRDDGSEPYGAANLVFRREHVRNAAEPRTSRTALVASIALHLAVLLVLVPVPTAPATLAPEAQQHQVEMEFVQQPQTRRGAPPATADAAAKPEIKTAASASPLPPTSTPAEPVAAQAAPAPPAGATASHWQTSMLDEPGDAPEDEAVYRATSDELRPTRPDSAYRNMPPRYPADAARRGQRGVVDLIVHVRPDGRAGEVELAASSGVASLDHAAVEALSKWHFQPQMNGTEPVPSQFRIAVHYDGSGP